MDSSLSFSNFNDLGCSYLTKYIAKAEPTHVFNIKEGDKFREHVVVHRLGSMELIFLL